MCLSPSRILNPSKYIDPNKCQQLYLSIPCGHCSECISSYRNEWRIRCYFECLDLFSRDKNSFVLFDTLTYRNGALPRLSDFAPFDVPDGCDFPCFSKYDIQCFNKRLRKSLPKNVSYRYFIASEYGSVRHTARPHYHCLFFVSGDITSLEFSRLVSSAWSYKDSDGIHYIGRTDGIPFRDSSYVNKNTFDEPSSILPVVNYISKYVTKDYNYCSLADKRLDKLVAQDIDISSIRSLVRPFHLQSTGFGFSDLIVLNDILQFGVLRILGNNGLPSSYSLPKGYKRKLLYDYYRDELGDVHWKLNSHGFYFNERFAYRLVDNLASRLQESDGVFNLPEVYRDKAFNMLFRDGRFGDPYSKDLHTILSESFNIDSGLRNYSAIDRPIKKCVFTATDYGSEKHGYSSMFLQHMSLDDIIDNGFVFLEELKKLVTPDMVSLPTISPVDDAKLKVDRLIRRVQDMFNINLIS